MLISHEGLIKQLRAEVDILSKGFEKLVEATEKQKEINVMLQQEIELLNKDSDNIWYVLEDKK